MVALGTSIAKRAPILVWNASASVPVGLYRIEATGLRRGDLALVKLAPDIARLADRRVYLPRSALLLKPVVATVGAHVCRQGSLVLINGTVASIARIHDRHGRVMPTWHGCRDLAFGDVFILGPGYDSFDSRYFGPIPVDRVVGRARALWTL